MSLKLSLPDAAGFMSALLVSTVCASTAATCRGGGRGVREGVREGWEGGSDLDAVLAQTHHC